MAGRSCIKSTARRRHSLRLLVTDRCGLRGSEEGNFRAELWVVGKGRGQLMDEWTIKIPNPICRLFFKIDLLTDFAAWCLTDFIDWRSIHSWLVFSTQLVNCCPMDEGSILLYCCPSTRVSFETSFYSKQTKLEPKLVSALSEKNLCFGCLASIPKQRVSMFRLNRNKQKTNRNSLIGSIFC